MIRALLGPPNPHFLPHVNPFTEDVFSGSLVSEPTYRPLYSKERAQLLRLVRSAGRRRLSPKNAKGLTALIKSEKAGEGKSHFLAAFAADYRDEAHFCTIPLVEADTMNWTEWFRDLLFSLHDQRDTASEGTSLTRRTAVLFSSATSDLIAKGKIPCDDPAAAAAWLGEHGFAERSQDRVDIDALLVFWQWVETLDLYAEVYA